MLYLRKHGLIDHQNMYSIKYYVKPKVMQLLMYVQYKYVQLTMCLTHVFSRMFNVKIKRPVCFTYFYYLNTCFAYVLHFLFMCLTHVAN